MLILHSQEKKNKDTLKVCEFHHTVVILVDIQLIHSKISYYCLKYAFLIPLFCSNILISFLATLNLIVLMQTNYKESNLPS